jgi:hypothetical protein
MSNLTAVLIAIFSVGGAGALTVIIKGLDNWRSGASAKEARAIQNLERYREEALQERDFEHTLKEYWRDRAGNAEFKIRNEWGSEHLPEIAPIPKKSDLKVTDDG